MIRLLKVLREIFYVLVSEFPKYKAFLNREEHQNDFKSKCITFRQIFLIL